MTSKNPYGLTRANRVNLDKLATYLESLPRSYRHFDMEKYVGDEVSTYDDRLIDYMRNNGGLYDKCGTVGCALGHGPAAGVLAAVGTEIVVNDDGTRYVDWYNYSGRFVGPETDERRKVWDFLFSGMWGALDFSDDREYVVKVDDHHYGAAARIRFILDGNEIPEDFYDTDRQSMARAKKLYKEYRK